jgi:hypothetical protein
MFILRTNQELLIHELMCHIMGYDQSLCLKEFLDQFNLLYISICLYFAIDQKLWARKLIERVMYCDHSLARKKILKFIFYFIVLFLTIYICKYFLLLVPFSHQGNVIMFSF